MAVTVWEMHHMSSVCDFMKYQNLHAKLASNFAPIILISLVYFKVFLNLALVMTFEKQHQTPIASVD